ncbi:MAG: hypothetical protein GF370_04610 [Candidatus Nealsonbacteria bacterium]|nr:hypothetical protein [Candidatus Nealsonbacteria bacterium]
MPKAKSQGILELDEIREGAVVLQNKQLRGVLMVSSVNFDLESEEKQKSIIFNFQNFLNSLDFPIQIVIQSRKLNITGYLDRLEELEKKEENELLRVQIKEYREFIKEMVQKKAIMSKNFFVVVPFSIGELPSRSEAERKENKRKVSLDEERFQRARKQLWQRMEFVSLGLRRCSLKCTPLNTLDLFELFWGLYHPEESEVGYFPELPPELSR